MSTEPTNNVARRSRPVLVDEHGTLWRCVAVQYTPAGVLLINAQPEVGLPPGGAANVLLPPLAPGRYIFIWEPKSSDSSH